MKQPLPEQQRLDAWLWCARLVKTRSRAADLVREGRVRINRQATDKPHARLRPGDVLTLPLGHAVRVLAVKALALRRGPAQAALLLYDEVPEGEMPERQSLLRGPDGDGIGRRPGSGSQPEITRPAQPMEN